MRNPYRARFHVVGHPLATSVPFVVPLVGGLGSCCESPVPALSTGTGYFRRSSRGPQARGGVWGNAPGGIAGLIVQENQHQSARQQSNDADPLSVGFSTLSTTMYAACPACNTRPRWFRLARQVVQEP
jgi:hypothetical protein